VYKSKGMSLGFKFYSEYCVPLVPSSAQHPHTARIIEYRNLSIHGYWNVR